jgi:hypothetical protein
MKMEIWMNEVEPERVARQGDGNRRWTRINADLNCGYTARGTACPVTGAGKKDSARNVFGGTPNTAVETTALPSGSDFRVLAFIRVHSRVDAELLDLSASAYASR